MFELEERVALAQAVCAQWPNVRVDGFSGLLVDHLRQTGANVLLRGVRSLSDFDYEQQLVGMYRRMVPDLRITSYNVCYTKLLRRRISLPMPSETVMSRLPSRHLTQRHLR